MFLQAARDCIQRINRPVGEIVQFRLATPRHVIYIGSRPAFLRPFAGAC